MDKQISEILNSEINEENKAKLYKQTLRKFLTFKRLHQEDDLAIRNREFELDKLLSQQKKTQSKTTPIRPIRKTQPKTPKKKKKTTKKTTSKIQSTIFNPSTSGNIQVPSSLNIPSTSIVTSKPESKDEMFKGFRKMERGWKERDEERKRELQREVEQLMREEKELERMRSNQKQDEEEDVWYEYK